MKKPNTKLLKELIERIILPKFQSLKLHEIKIYPLTNFYEYDVRFLTKKKLSVNEQAEIIREMNTLFKMAALDSISPNKTEKDKIIVWFKTPKAKEFSFSANQPGL